MRVHFLSVSCVVGWLMGPWAAGQQPAAPAMPRVPLSGAPSAPPTELIPLSPVETFARFVRMTPVDREKFLQTRQPEHRRYLEEKLREYDALPPAERDARLRMLQLRYHLRSLMSAPASNRTARLKFIPSADLPLIEERLKLWDELKPEQQKEFFAHEAAVRALLLAETNAVPSALFTASQRDRIEKQISDWNQLPADKRQQIQGQFQQLFTMDEALTKKTLKTLGEKERQVLEQFGRLPEDQRNRCLTGFEKFTQLSPEERVDFIKAAARWQSMSETQRMAWRVISKRLPPGFPLPPLSGGPPLPPGLVATPGKNSR